MRYCTIPTDLATLAKAQAGQELEVRHLLGGAGRHGLHMAPGDRITCRGVSDNGVLVSTVNGSQVHVPWECARSVQVERVGIDDPHASDDERRPRRSIRLLTAGPVTRLIARKGGRRARQAAAGSPAGVGRRQLARSYDAILEPDGIRAADVVKR